MKAEILFTPILVTEIVYAQSFFLTSPATSPLMAGETRSYPTKYLIGSPPATVFDDILWYANQTDADAREDVLTDTTRLPIAVFTPTTPVGDAKVFQDGVIILTAPTTNGYDAPVPVIGMTQDRGDFIEPRIYLLDDTLVISDRIVDYDFRYAVGNPAMDMFAVEWYATRLDANLRIQQLPDTDRLPRPVWIPSIPDTSMGAEVLQDGVLRLYPPISETPYETAVGVLCVNQEDIHEDGDPKNIDVDAINVRQRLCVCPNWEDA